MDNHERNARRRKRYRELRERESIDQRAARNAKRREQYKEKKMTSMRQGIQFLHFQIHNYFFGLYMKIYGNNMLITYI